MTTPTGSNPTIGEQVINRINDIEAVLQQMQARDTQDTRIDDLQRHINNLRNQLGSLGASTAVGAPTRDRRSIYNSKEFLPDKLGSGYKDAWRSWAYKARDWLGQYDATLPSKLLTIESKTSELTPEYILSLNIFSDRNSLTRSKF